MNEFRDVELYPELYDNLNEKSGFKPCLGNIPSSSPFIERSYRTKRAGEKMVCINEEENE